MFITVNTPGALLRLDVNLTDTVYSLKLLIAGYVGILPEHQRLLYNGIQLIDMGILNDYNIKAESIITEVPISNCPCKPIYKKKTISNAMSVSGRAKTSYHGGMYGIITVSESDGGTGTGTGTDSSSSFTWPASMVCLSSAQTCNIPYFNRVQSHLFPGTRSRTTKRGWNCRR
jgi:hypothetical protein